MTTPEPTSERRSVALAFLQRVLPATGTYFGVIRFAARAKGPRPVKRVACHTLVELWDILSSEATADTYFSTASFKDNTSSSSANVAMLQAFRLDIDCGKDKLYANATEGMIAATAFAKKANLPPFALVQSGNGVHAWWPLSTPLSRAVWERYADGLKQACKTHNFFADQVVTTDAARILRCPGTYNHKCHPAVEVKLQPHFFECGPYDISAFESLLTDNVIQFTPFPDQNKSLDTYYQRASGKIPPCETPALYSKTTVAFYASMLAAIPLAVREERQVWFETGAAIHELGWGENGFKLWCMWSQKSAKFNAADQIKTWESFSRPYDGPKITSASLYHHAQQYGWKPPTDSPLFSENVTQPVTERLKHEQNWSITASGKIKDHNYQNCRVAMALLNIKARHNVFVDKKEAILPWVKSEWVPFSDDIVSPIRKQILDQYKFDPGKDCVFDALDEFANEGAFDPVIDYLNNLKWDGVERLNTWLTTYMGVTDNELHRCFGVTTLIAAVRRAFNPGTKFDHMLIFEGRQGTGKSTVIEILGLKDYYKNQTINFQDPRSVVEAINGAWFYEWAELAGMRRADVERLKTVLSTSVDSARMAYGRVVKTRPRRCVFIGTTNAVGQDFLTDYTGGRRYWPVITKTIDLNNLRRDVDQLFAEAMVVEKTYGSLTLPEKLISPAINVQKAHTQAPLWMDMLVDVKGYVVDEAIHKEERILTKDIISQYLRLTAAQIHSGTYREISTAMQELGWQRTQINKDGKLQRGYKRIIQRRKSNG